jgi:hypothetical protein
VEIAAAMDFEKSILSDGVYTSESAFIPSREVYFSH